MDILKAFVLNGKDYNINILWQDGKPLFRANEIGNILEITNVRTSITSFDHDEKVVRITSTLGGPQETVFLTESGLYRLLMCSRKPVARPFQKWVCKVLESIRETGKYELEVKLKESKERIQAALEDEAIKTKTLMEQNLHDSLCQAYKNRYVVYLAKIKIIDDKILIKIGSSKDLSTREEGLQKTFGSAFVFKVFECPLNEPFEKFLHNHPVVRKYIYKDVINNDHRSFESFLVTQEELDEITRIATHNKFKFSSTIEYEQLREIETIKLKQIEAKKDLVNLQNKSTIDVDNDTYIDPVILLTDNRKHTQSKGKKIQKYLADGKTLITTYESYAYAMRDDGNKHTSRTAIKNAIKKKTLYKGFRWAELDRQLVDDTIQTLDDTVDAPTINNGYVAMLNLDKTHIVKVFCDKKAAKEDRKFTSSASISNAIKRGSVSSGHYFVMWEDCSNELKTQYLSTNQLPHKRVTGVQIAQLHPITKVQLETYSCIEDVIKKYKISRATLKSACEYKYLAKGYYWEFAYT